MLSVDFILKILCLLNFRRHMVLTAVMELAMHLLKRLQHQCPPVVVMVLILQHSQPRYVERLLCISLLLPVCILCQIALLRLLCISILLPVCKLCQIALFFR